MPGPGIRMNKVTIPIMIVFVLFFVYMVWFSGDSEKKSVSPPAMPESKSEATVKSEPELKSPVLDKALEIRLLIDKLYKEDFKVIPDLNNNTVKNFLKELLVDNDAKKIFRQFSKTNVCIFLSDGYAIGDGYVKVRCNDGVKKVAQWLATGKN